MALLPIHQYFIFNRAIKPVHEFIPSENEGGIYEVIRIIDGVPLFLTEHLERFKISAGIANKVIPFEASEIKNLLIQLIKSNSAKDGNVLISLKTNLKAFFIPHKYPTQEQYLNGVDCGLLHAERHNPNAKVFQTLVRKKANELIANHNYYEVLLVDHLGRITEGSRSNVFFIKGDILLTPPADEVLLGITRQKTMECAKKSGLEIVEKEILSNEINHFDAAFITGTSPKILPVKNIGNSSFSPNNKVLRQIMTAFEAVIKVQLK